MTNITGSGRRDEADDGVVNGGASESRDHLGRFRKFLEHSPLLISEFDAAGRHLFANRAVGGVFERSPDEVVGKTLAELLPPETAGLFLSRIGRVFAERAPITIEDRIGEDGHDRYFITTLFPLFGDGGLITSVGSIAHDITTRTHSEEELEEERKRLQFVIDGARLGTWEWNVQTNETVFNETWATMIGYTIEELAPYSFETWESLVHPDDLDFARERLTRAVGGDGDYECEFRMKHRDGRWVWILDRGRVMTRDSEGKALLMYGTHSEVTARKQAEQTTARSARRLSAVVEVLQTPTKTTQEFLDRALEKAIELSDSRIGYIYFYDEETRVFTLNTWSKEVMHECAVKNPETRYELDATGIWGEAVRQRKPVVVNDFQSPHPLKKGYPAGHAHLSSFLTIPVFDRERIVAVAGVANKPDPYDETDVLELTLLMDSVWRSVEFIRSESALAASEERFRTLFESMAAGSGLHEVIYDAGIPVDYRILDINESYERITGIKRRSAVGALASRLYGTGNAPYLERYARVAETGVPDRFNVYFEPADKHLEVTVSRPAPKMFSTVFTDITERVAAEAESEKLREQLTQAQKMESIGRLAGGVAHDFNNMLGVILGHGELALESIDANDPLHASLSEIIRAARRSADLTRQLLAFARRQIASPKVLDLNETVSGMLNMLRRLIGEDIDLVWAPAVGLWNVLIDPSQVDQVLANLCVNARDAIEGVGSVTIETGNAVIDEEYCADHAETLPGQYVRLVVSDTGKGMDRATLGSVFDPFFTTKPVGKGTGLGLATVYGVVRQNAGFINVYSELDHGSSFAIYLPRHDGDPSVPSADEAVELIQGDRESILLVEDESLILAMGKRMLDRLGYRVLDADSPEKAIEIATTHRCDIRLLMTDIVMPGMNGRDLAKRITEICPDVKVLFTSGYTANVIAHHGVLEDGVQFIQKPFDLGTLSTKISEILGGRRRA